jgi:hypothetical protein
MAFWMKVDCTGTSPELEYLNSMLSLSAASCAPFLMTSKNASPSGAWLIIAKVIRGESVPPPPPAGAFCAPPLLLHAAVAINSPVARPRTTRRLREPNIDVPSCGPGFHKEGPG